jgi:hypothetical protein
MYSPNIWLKILSKFTSFFFSRYLCITLRTLKAEEETVNRERNIDCPHSIKQQTSFMQIPLSELKLMIQSLSSKVGTQPAKKSLLLRNREFITVFTKPAIDLS